MNTQFRHGNLRNVTKDYDESPVDEPSRRVSRWVVVMLILVALATPLLLYNGPDVMYPAAPVIADAALEGHLSLHSYAPPASDEPAALQ